MQEMKCNTCGESKEVNIDNYAFRKWADGIRRPHPRCRKCKNAADSRTNFYQTEKKCTGVCGKSYPATSEYFTSQVSTTGRRELVSKCKTCRNEINRAYKKQPLGIVTTRINSQPPPPCDKPYSSTNPRCQYYEKCQTEFLACGAFRSYQSLRRWRIREKPTRKTFNIIYKNTDAYLGG